jgi:xanthine dehydrogenase accessory factor
MKDLLPQISSWVTSDTPFAIATVIKTWGSSPRPVGSTMIISQNGEIAGSVSGGCVEGAVVQAAKDIIESGVTRLLQFGVSNDDAWAVGLSCGGKITVFVERFISFDQRSKEQQVWLKLKEHLEHDRACVLVSEIETGQTDIKPTEVSDSGANAVAPGQLTTGAHTVVMPDGSNIGHSASPNLLEAVLNAHLRRQHAIFEEAGVRFFLQVIPRRNQMLIIGAAHITADLVELAKAFDFETIVIDPRGAFASKTQFQTSPDKIFEKYPSEVIPDYKLDAYTYAVILSHDPKIDDNALHLLLESNVGYIGALGSKKTHAKRVDRLREAGFSDAQIDRIQAPIGLNINAKKPREIALSIMAQIIGVMHGFE